LNQGRSLVLAYQTFVGFYHRDTSFGANGVCSDLLQCINLELHIPSR
jgi:hypothetical protein